MQELEKASEEWERKTAKLAELEDWLLDAGRELKGAAQDDARHIVFDQVNEAAIKLRKEMDEIEEQMEAALTAALKESGPVSLELEDGTTQTLSATGHTAGGGASLLPRDLLSVWRVAKVFQGSVYLGGQPAQLKFGDKEQVATVKLSPKIKKPKKDAVIGEGTLFGKE